MESSETTYLDYPTTTDEQASGIDEKILCLGNALLDFLYTVSDATENPAKQNQAEERKLVSLILNCIQWLKGTIGSYEQLSLNSLAANMRGMYECHVTLTFLMKQNNGSARKYLDKYDKFRYAEKYRMLDQQEKEKPGKIQSEYQQYAKPLFQHKKEKIDKEWTGEGLSVLDISRRAGFDQNDYEEYYKRPALYIRNTSLIQDLFSSKSDDDSKGYTQECATLTLYVFQHCIQIAKKYADYLQKDMPARETNHWIAAFRTVARKYQDD